MSMSTALALYHEYEYSLFAVLVRILMSTTRILVEGCGAAIVIAAVAITAPPPSPPPLTPLHPLCSEQQLARTASV